MPVTGLSARQFVIAVVNTVLLGIGVTGVTPSERNCAEADERDRKSKEYRKIEARRVGGQTGRLRSVQLLKISHDKILVQISFDETAAK